MRGPAIFFAHLFDVLASLAFVAAVITAVKPELLAGGSFERMSSKVTENIGGMLLQVTLVQRPPEDVMALRNVWVTVFFACYTLLKVAVISLSKSGKKIVALLMLLLILLSCFLVADKFLLFLVFCVLLYVSFELLCEFSGGSVRVKLLLLALVTACLYIVSHILLVESARAAFSAIGSAFRGLGAAFAGLFRQLSLPVLWW